MTVCGTYHLDGVICSKVNVAACLKLGIIGNDSLGNVIYNRDGCGKAELVGSLGLCLGVDGSNGAHGDVAVGGNDFRTARNLYMVFKYTDIYRYGNS